MVARVEPGQRFGEYVLQRRLGAGGQGEVFEAVDSLGMVWALKVGHRVFTEDQTALARFAREAQWVNSTLGALPRNSGVLVGEHYGVHDFRFYVKMRLIQGESLAQRLKRQGPFELIEAIKVAQQLAEIVAVAHQHHAIHRDLKPENVLLETHGGIQVVDWGCIHLVEAGQLAVSGAGPLCTLGYAAPEQYRLENAPTAATDVYALGVILVEMLTGYNPFLNSWRNHEYAVGQRNGDRATRTAVPPRSSGQVRTGMYPTTPVRNVREGLPEAITRATAPTDVLRMEERLVDFPQQLPVSLMPPDTRDFRPLSVAEVLKRQLTFDLTTFPWITTGLPEPLVLLLTQMLQVQPERRPSSMREVALRLSEALVKTPNVDAVAASHPPGRRGRLVAPLALGLASAGAVIWWAISRGETTADGPQVSGERSHTNPAMVSPNIVDEKTRASAATLLVEVGVTATPGSPGSETNSPFTVATSPTRVVEADLSTSRGSPSRDSLERRKAAVKANATPSKAVTPPPTPTFVDAPYFKSKRTTSQ